jgi:hypothetical protein
MAANMDRDQELRHLAQADRHIVEVKKHIAKQRNAIMRLKAANHPTETAESMLSTLEGSLGVLERHRKLILDELSPPPQAPRRSLPSRSVQQWQRFLSTIRSTGASAPKRRAPLRTI